jgi:hypothetical protein
MTVHFFTLFDMKYATRGLAMLESVEATFGGAKTVTVLAMEPAVVGLLKSVGNPAWRVLEIDDLQDEELSAVRKTRPHREFCWTCAPAFSDYMVKNAQEGDTVAYLDADLYFFRSPQVLLDELGADGNILIHEHRYSKDRQHYEPSSGRFNVGFVAFRVSEEARRCTGRWRQQVMDKCVLDPENGYCGDQGYLNEWPALYSGLRILKNLGGGVAPWNLTSYKVSGSKAHPQVDGVDVVFFHYHSFRTISVGGLKNIAAIPAWGYDFPAEANRLLFASYASRLRRFGNLARRQGYLSAADTTHPIREAVRAWLKGNIVLAI